MSDADLDEVRRFWNTVAADWRIQVGDEGDLNRRWISDPVLWDLLGDVDGRVVLDAGCGTGYLTRQLHRRGATAVGVDVSEEMIAIARDAHPDLDFRVDSISVLRTVGDETIDLILSNYVLMDAPDLQGAAAALHRVLKPGGLAVVLFSHPCFPQGRAKASGDGSEVTYIWDFSYFDEQRRVDPPWGHFTSEFIWFHRPLSAYWKAFTRAGFEVTDLEEPRITPERFRLVDAPARLQRARTRPYSIAFRLRKRA